MALLQPGATLPGDPLPALDSRGAATSDSRGAAAGDSRVAALIDSRGTVGRPLVLPFVLVFRWLGVSLAAFCLYLLPINAIDIDTEAFELLVFGTVIVLGLVASLYWTACRRSPARSCSLAAAPSSSAPAC